MTIGRRRTAVIAAFLLLGTAACRSGDPPPAPLDVAALPEIRLAVQTVEVESRAEVPAAQNFIGRRRAADLAASAADYLRARVAAAGGDLFGRATVEEASMVERAREGGGGLLSTEPDWEMVGVLALRVAVVDGLGIENGFASSRVEIRRSLARGASVEARDRFTRTLTNDLVAAAGRDLEQSVAQNLGQFRAP